MRVLLIEDDRMVGAAVTQALRDAAYAIDWVTDGKAAVDAVEAETYDLALLDLGLPLVGGLTLLRHFRKSYRDLPVIIVTARDVVDDRVDGLDLSADDYLTSPSRFENCSPGCGRFLCGRAAEYLRSSATAWSVSIRRHTMRASVKGPAA